jgi:hypothetical protein
MQENGKLTVGFEVLAAVVTNAAISPCSPLCEPIYCTLFLAQLISDL